MTIRLIQPIYINGRQHKPGTIIDVNDSIAQWLVERGRAERMGEARGQATAQSATAADAPAEPMRSAKRKKEEGRIDE